MSAFYVGMMGGGKGCRQHGKNLKFLATEHDHSITLCYYTPTMLVVNQNSQASQLSL